MTSCPCAASTEKTEFPESNDDDDDDDDDLDSLGPISSEEALLAVERMVRDYRRSNARRAKAVRRNRREGPKRGTHRSIVIDENIAGRDDAPSPGLEFGPSATELAAARERRAEKSRKAYASRLANAAAKNSTVAPTVAAKGEEISPKEKPSFSGPPSTSRTAAQAFQRLEAILDDQSNNEEGVRINLSAMVEYVRDILVVKRLTGRKDLLLRILREVLDLRGKCVPMAMTRKTVSEQKKSNGFVFASACRVEILGEFVLSRLEELEQ